MAENKNKLVATKETAIATYDDDLLSGGTGLEETTAEDFAIPFIRILQQMSPQLNKQDGRYNEEAQAGMLVNTVTNEVYDGDTGVTVVPCAYVKKYIEWIPREKGGGLVDASHNASILKSCTNGTVFCVSFRTSTTTSSHSFYLHAIRCVQEMAYDA